MLKANGPIWKLDSSSERSNGITNGSDDQKQTNEAPSVKNVIGISLPHIGAYKKLDNKKQVVALIDDVRAFRISNN